jgi:hypothetical protein
MFVTSQGSAHGRFNRAIQQRNLWAAENSLRELGRVSLEDALGYLDLLAEQKPEKLERAAVRWHGRLETEAPNLDFGGVSTRGCRASEPLRRGTGSGADVAATVGTSSTDPCASSRGGLAERHALHTTRQPPTLRRELERDHRPKG